MRERRKEPRKGSEIEPEIIHLQSVGHPYYDVPHAFCIMSLRLTVYGKVKLLNGAEAKASTNSAI